MAQVNDMLDTLLARLTPSMLSCALPSLHVDIRQNSAGDFLKLPGKWVFDWPRGACPSISCVLTAFLRSSGSSSETDKEQTMSALSYLLHWWILVILVAPSAHTAKCVEKMPVLLTAIGQHSNSVLNCVTA